MKKLKRRLIKNIFVIKITFLLQKIKIIFGSKEFFHVSKIKKILSAKKLFGINFFVETGTYLGVTINYIKNYFSIIYSIELSEKLSSEAQNYFKNKKNITVLHGDSGLLIERLLKNNNEKKLFWLDAHYSAGITAVSENFGDTPIIKEMETILNYWVDGSVILIDDARLFNGTNSYPTISILSDYIDSRNLKLKMFVDEDIIHIL